jgi:biotin synthesis protein BioG
MRLKYLHKNNSPKLILFMSGWACDEIPFQNILSDDYDVLMCYDYRDLSQTHELKEELKTYHEYYLIAWSLGVFVSSILFKDNKNLFQTCLAINGSLSPINDEKGIPPSIFQGTIDGLNEKGRDKFFMRMCGGRSGYTSFMKHQPQRSVEDQKEELICLQNMILKEAITWDIFHKVLLSSRDMIFPFKNLEKAWENKSQKLIIDLPHFCFTAWNSWDEILKIQVPRVI